LRGELPGTSQLKCFLRVNLLHGGRSWKRQRPVNDKPRDDDDDDDKCRLRRISKKNIFLSDKISVKFVMDSVPPLSLNCTQHYPRNLFYFRLTKYVRTKFVKVKIRTQLFSDKSNYIELLLATSRSKSS